jgi:triacylglycerol lipase
VRTVPKVSPPANVRYRSGIVDRSVVTGHAASGQPPRLGQLALLRQEALAFARVAALLPLDRAARLPDRVDAGDDVVVLVHGLLATAGVMRPLREDVERRTGAKTASFTYLSGTGVRRIAEDLRELLDRLPRGVRIHLVGHSLGGLVVRWFVQEVASDFRVAQTITVAAPFEGARGARLMPGEAGRDIRAGSPVLERLRQGALRTESLPHCSIYGAFDAAVPSGTRFGIGEHVLVPDCGHNALLFHPTVGDVVARRVAACGRQPK